MAPPQAELYFRSNATLAEGPVWSEGILYWVDIPAKALCAKSDSASAAERYELDLEIGSFALWGPDRTVLATERGFQCLNLTTRHLTGWVNPEQGIPENRFNDGKCDPRGRFVAGTMNRKGATGKGALYILENERCVRRLYGPVTCSNGLAWSADGQTLYYIDTPAQTVRSFRYDLETAGLSEERAVIQIPAASGKPDGMTIDREGNLWIALWNGGAVECWNPKSGKRLFRVDLPVARVSSCIFGGNDYKTLYITTAKSEATSKSAAGLEGAIFCAKPGIAGFPAVSFAPVT